MHVVGGTQRPCRLQKPSSHWQTPAENVCTHVDEPREASQPTSVQSPTVGLHFMPMVTAQPGGVVVVGGRVCVAVGALVAAAVVAVVGRAGVVEVVACGARGAAVGARGGSVGSFEVSGLVEEVVAGGARGAEVGACGGSGASFGVSGLALAGGAALGALATAGGGESPQPESEAARRAAVEATQRQARLGAIGAGGGRG
mmetsp:Transcript_24636/g.77991  ORF Transcript_24636/g.77991 Transcript_24636/m.77991 type:complete len:200 (-) Transcript_24636:28-627(-)